MVKTYFKRIKAQSELIRAFHSAGLYKTYRNSGGREIQIYPKIHDIKFEENYTEYTFTLINGMDPKELIKKSFVFKQHFGKSLDLEGDLKKFTLKIHKKPMPKVLKYNFQEVSPNVEKLKLGIICGMNRNGQYEAYDFLKQPHLLIAGETGSGKSTQLRSIITTLIKTKRPEELKLYLADCKKSEFHIFRNVDHVECVLSSVLEIKNMLQHVKNELDERSILTEIFEVSHIDELPKEHRKPYLVVCIDEFVMLRKDETIMSILTEIVAIGRTLGVFVILSMQRPNAKVLDTTIRANLTVSMGFKLRDSIESRIVNTPGSESIEQSGRFIMNGSKIVEIQAPFLPLEHAKSLLEPFKVSKDFKKVAESTVHSKRQEPLTEKDVFLDDTNKA